MVSSFSFPGIRTLGGNTGVSALTTKTDAAKQSGSVLANRQPSGGAEPIDSGNQVQDPTSTFLVNRSKEILGDPKPERSVRAQLVNVSVAFLDRQAKQLDRIAENAPKLDLEELQKTRVEKKLEKKERPEKDFGEEDDSDARRAEASRRYIEAQSAKEEDSGPAAGPEPKTSRSDVAAGGATGSEKGDPQVNTLA